MPPQLSVRRPRRHWLTTSLAGLITVGAAIGITLLLLPSGKNAAPHTTANNLSRNFRACLITNDPNAAPAQTSWSGMREAADTTDINAQRIVTPTTATTPATLLPYINSLIQRKCGLIISAGPHLDETITQAAKLNPHQHFLTTGTPISLHNITTLPTPTLANIADAVRTASQSR